MDKFLPDTLIVPQAAIADTHAETHETGTLAAAARVCGGLSSSTDSQPCVALASQSLFVDESVAALGSPRTEGRGQ
ncbi:unnamed protein product [Arctogadus glacialis]